ncbi:sensor histidine kinase [Kitasatospora sp. MBT63]|uniref:sensor histidine kinase n=1 Tax=Kitasatospora sp. MBT63 TaxID=1444768 RepID=UPI00053AECFD|nr:sensor histidine kinase [Kitasatospora sp. MBT63]
MDLRRPLQRWRACGKPQRTEIYIRWSLYLMALIQPLAVLALLGSPEGSALPRPVLAASLTASLAGTVMSVALFRPALAHYLGRSARPTGRVAASAVLTVGCAWVVLLLRPAAPDGAPPPHTALIATALVLWFAPVSIALTDRGAATLAGAGALLLTAPVLLLSGTAPATTLGLLAGTGASMALIAVTCRCSAWLAKVVWELDDARERQSRLAVAEERLRFSRDLHDVLGRNLTTIALKSELAVQLARRGRPEAADQMTEVQRIAQESQREVREVVRGYRTADLRAEVAGARSVLRAAGVDCTVDLGPDPAALPAVAQSVLGWVVREATTNVLRHSEAGHCTVRLRTTGGLAVLEVENDGVPPGRKDTGQPGTGLAGLGERLAAHGGGLSLPAAAAGGFRLAATLPLTSPAPAPEVAAR